MKKPEPNRTILETVREREREPLFKGRNVGAILIDRNNVGASSRRPFFGGMTQTSSKAYLNLTANNLTSSKAITLIALIITIIVLIILTAVGITALAGEHGLMNMTGEAKTETIKKAAIEMLNLKITNIQIANYKEKQRMPNLKELAIALDPEEDKEVESVTKQSKNTASLEWINDTDYSSIYVILKDYNQYEFEINSELQLASVNGVTVASTKSDYNELKAEIDNLKSEIKSLKEAGSIQNNVEWTLIGSTSTKDSIIPNSTTKQLTQKGYKEVLMVVEIVKHLTVTSIVAPVMLISTMGQRSFVSGGSDQLRYRSLYSS